MFSQWWIQVLMNVILCPTVLKDHGVFLFKGEAAHILDCLTLEMRTTQTFKMSGTVHHNDSTT
jgi:hypothetical protein